MRPLLILATGTAKLLTLLSFFALLGGGQFLIPFSSFFGG